MNLLKEYALRYEEGKENINILDKYLFKEKIWPKILGLFVFGKPKKILEDYRAYKNKSESI